MKKLICLSLVLLALLGSVTACNFAQDMAGSLAENAESTPKVEEMMAALAENRTSDAKALMHPQVIEESEAAIAQMSSYIAGRKVSSMELAGMNIRTSASTGGSKMEEQAAYHVTLEDGAVIYLSTVYLSTNDGKGFISFQLVLGIV